MIPAAPRRMQELSNHLPRERPRRPFPAWTLALTLVAAGARDGSPESTGRAEPAGAARVTIRVERALAHPIPATTSGAIAVGNLESRVRAVEARLARRADDPRAIADLTDLLLARAQYLGRLGDYERAARLSEQLVSVSPADSRSWLVRAAARAALHEFEGALADLARAEALGASRAAVAAARADILDASGQTESAVALREEVAVRRPTITTLAALATSRALAGQESEANVLFARALASYRDVSPFPVAWLLVQRGLAWERAGDLDDARAAFALAHERLPAYAAAASGLARLTAADGDHLGAAAILRGLTATSDDPEYVGQRAGELHAVGEAEEADRLRAEAARALDTLVARYPDAFIAKQVRFWLGPGVDPDRGFTLARRYLAARGSTPPALALAAEAALAVQRATETRRRS